MIESVQQESGIGTALWSELSLFFFFSSRRRHTRLQGDWSSDVCSSDLGSDLQDQGLQAFVQIDRAQASRLGVTVSAIDTALYNAFGQRLISTIFTQSNQDRKSVV